MTDNRDAYGEDDDEEEEKANLAEEERKEKEDKEQSRQTRSDQRSTFDFIENNCGDAENINSSVRQAIREKVNDSFDKIIHTREQLNDALLLREESLILRNMAAKMDDVSR